MRIQKYIITALCGALMAVACNKDDEGIGIKTKPDYSGIANDNGIPTYADYYINIAGWDYHSSWNLANVHDPSIQYFSGDGYYYMFGTDASYGNEHEKAAIGKHFQGKRSKDLVNWTHVYGPFNDVPSWVPDSLTSIRARMGLEPIESPAYGYWAPCIREYNGKLRMYYSIVVDNFIKTGKQNTAANFDNSWTERAFIGVCESSNPSDPDSWVDLGFVVCSSTDKANTADAYRRDSYYEYGTTYFYFNSIDPTYHIDDEGRHWLIYGSWHSGFALLEINPETGLPVNAYDDAGNFVGLGDPWGANPNYGTRIGTRNISSRWQASEAPEIVYKDGYYYLFMAYDELDVPYNTRVVRAESIEGPYYDITGRNFTNGRGDTYPIVTHPYKFNNSHGWVGLSHCCIFQQNGTGDWFYCSQGRLPNNVEENASSNAIMMGHVRRVVWCPASASELDNLWPLVLPERYAGLDKTAVSESEIAGSYELIVLAYTKGVQNTSINLVLTSDGAITQDGESIGTWSFDASSQYLTATIKSTTLILVAAHEADWERVETVTDEDGEETTVQARKETVVLVGTEKNLNGTVWGKKLI